jgi:NH3-dependent NAD+ synthetase
VLGPYSQLDALLYAYQKKGLDSAGLKGVGFDSDYVDEIVRRVRNSQFKRLQAAPGAVLPSSYKEL